MAKPVASDVIDDGPVLVPTGVPIYVQKTGARLVRLEDFDMELPDGDIINLVVANGGLSSDHVELSLRVKPGMWFKGVEVYRGNGVVKLEAENGGTTGVHVVHRQELTTVWMVFIKAKEFGIHRQIYELPGPDLKALLGKSIVLDWVKD